jgi:ribonuclease-3
MPLRFGRGLGSGHGGSRWLLEAKGHGGGAEPGALERARREATLSSSGAALHLDPLPPAPPPGRPLPGPPGAVERSPHPPVQPVPDLPHAFVDTALLEEALTHASARPRHNERLEFLGDAVLDLVVAEELFGARTDLPEGELTVRKSHVVSRPTLAEAADRLGLTPRLRVGKGLRKVELSSTVRAGLFEAVVGAVYLDGGLEAARSFVHATLADSLDRARAEAEVVVPKQRLQELAQRDGGAPPTYELLEEVGEAHAPRFRVRAVVAGTPHPEAWGSTLKEAEMEAARLALAQLEGRESGDASTREAAQEGAEEADA